MLKAIVAATAALTIATSTFAYAQPRGGKQDGARNTTRTAPSMEDMRAMQSARLAALHAGLVLNTDQERHWPAFEQAMREIQKQRLDRFNARREARSNGQQAANDPAERMARRAARLSESGAALKRLADATGPLFGSLDEAQKRRFALLSRISRDGRGGGERRQGRQQRGSNEFNGKNPGKEPAVQDGVQDGERRTDLAPTDEDEVPQPKLLQTKPISFTGPSTFGSKSNFGPKSTFGVNIVNPDQAVFSNQAIDWGAAVSPSRKITIGEPTAFGRKTVQSI